MSLLPDIVPTPDLEVELQRVVQAVPDDELSALARTEPAFQTGGFRAGHAAAIRARIGQMAAGGAPLPEGVRRVLHRHSLGRSLTRLLSPAALVELRHEWCALFGTPRVLLALLLDEREDVRATAARWLQAPVTAPAIDPAQAAARAREAFARLLEAAQATAQGVPATREAWQEARQQLEQQVRELRADCRRLKAAEETINRNREKLAAGERELAAARERLQAAEAQARQAARERDAARTELERERRYREERLAAGVEAKLAEEAADWLRDARAIREAAAQPPSTDLLARADDALARQAATDRHTGNRQTVAARLDEVQRRLERAREAVSHALHPVPDLKSVADELAAEADRLRRMLGRPLESSAVEGRLAAAFALAAPNELPARRVLVEQLADLGALDGAGAERLRNQLQARQGAEQATFSACGTADTGETGTPLAALKAALAGRAAAVLLVDGHNVLFGLQARYLPPAGAAVPTAEARARLVDDVVRLTQGKPTCRAWIVFDGPARSERTAAPNVRVTYSGGEGEHRADTALLDNIRFFRTSSALPIVLASNDNGLCAEARRLGAETITATQFGSLMGCM